MSSDRRLALVLLAAVAACGSQDPGAMQGNGGDGGLVGGDYFPFKVGNSWDYDVTEIGLVTVRKVHKIVRMEAVGGDGPSKAKVVYRVETQKPASGGLGDATISWQNLEGSRVVRYREVSCTAGTVEISNGAVSKCTENEDVFWVPSRVRLDQAPMSKPFVKASSWPEEYSETKIDISNRTGVRTPTTEAKRETWEVTEVGVGAETAAGKFADCVVLKKTSPQEVAKSYTFCKGVGKVREDGAGQTEVLVKYSLQP